VKLSNSTDTRTVEVELTLQNWSGKFPESCPKFPSEYYIEDHRDTGGGLVVGKDAPQTGDVDQAIVDFVTPILAHAELLKSTDPVISALILNRAFTCSITIKCAALIASIGAELDLRVFPTDDAVEGTRSHSHSIR
jgi:hypothetical protein